VLCEADELGPRELEQVWARGYPSAANTSEVMRRVLCMLEAVEDELCLLEVPGLLEVSEVLEVMEVMEGAGGDGVFLYVLRISKTRRRLRIPCLSNGLTPLESHYLSAGTH